MTIEYRPIAFPRIPDGIPYELRKYFMKRDALIDEQISGMFRSVSSGYAGDLTFDGNIDVTGNQTINGDQILAGNLLADVSIPLVFGIVFSEADGDNNNVVWTAGKITYKNLSYTITAEETGDTKKYIYWDKAATPSILHTTDIFVDAYGTDRYIVCINDSGTPYPCSTGQPSYIAADGSIDTDALAAAAVATANIANAAITESLLGNDSVVAAKIAAGAVTTAKLDALAVTAAKIAAGAIETAKIAANAITTAKLNALAVTAGKIAANAVTADEIAAGAIETDKLAANAVTAAKIAAQTITAVTYAELRQTMSWMGQDSCDASKPFTMDFKLPSELIDIISVKLSFKLKNYRAYSTGAAAGDDDPITSSNTDLGDKESTAAPEDWEETGNVIPVIPNTEASSGDTGYTDVSHTHTVDAHDHELAYPSDTENEDCGGGVHKHGLGSLWDWGISEEAVSIDYWNSGNHKHTMGSHSHQMGDHQHYLSDPYAGHTHTITIGGHTHTVEISSHTHPISYGIYEEETSPTVHFHVDDGSGFGDASDNYEGNQVDIDITSQVTTAGWKAIRFDVDDRCRIVAILEVKVDITA